jgi:hypothetical protein
MEYLNEQFRYWWIGHGDWQNWWSTPHSAKFPYMVYKCKVNRRDKFSHQIFSAERCMSGSLKAVFQISIAL